MAVKGDLYRKIFKQKDLEDNTDEQSNKPSNTPRSWGYQSVQGTLNEQEESPTGKQISPGYRKPTNQLAPGLLGSEIGGMGGDPSGTGQTSGNMGTKNGKVTSDNIYEQRMSLAEQLADEQRRISQEAASYKRNSLSDQLDQQRRQYRQGLQAMSEQAYGRGSRLLDQLANRGLATSGLLQLGDVQNKMAQGQGLSELAYQDRMGRENIQDNQMRTESTLAQQLRQAELDRAQTEMTAEEQLYNRQQREEAVDRQTLNEQKDYALALLQSGADTEVYSKIMGAETPEELEAYLSSPEYKEDAIEVTSPSAAPEDVEQGVLGSSTLEEQKLHGQTPGIKFKIGGKEYHAAYTEKSLGKRSEEIQSQYDSASLRYSGTGLIEVDVSDGRKSLSSKPFIAGGERFKTWNEAADYLDSMKQ